MCAIPAALPGNTGSHILRYPSWRACVGRRRRSRERGVEHPHGHYSPLAQLGTGCLSLFANLGTTARVSHVSHFQGLSRASDGTFPSHHYTFWRPLLSWNFLLDFFRSEQGQLVCVYIHIYMHMYIINVTIATRIVKTNVFTTNQEGAGSPWQGASWAAGPHHAPSFATAPWLHVTSTTALLFLEDQRVASPSTSTAAVRLTCPHLMGCPRLASGTLQPSSWVSVDEGRQGGMAVLAQLNNHSACLVGKTNKQKMLLGR